MTSYILYDRLTGRGEGVPTILTSQEALDRNRRLEQTGDRSRRWVPDFTAQTEDCRHARTT